jgi:hypothetical protein
MSPTIVTLLQKKDNLKQVSDTPLTPQLVVEKRIMKKKLFGENQLV